MLRLSRYWCHTWLLWNDLFNLTSIWLLLEKHFGVFADELSWLLCWCRRCKILSPLITRTVLFIRYSWRCHSLTCNCGWASLSIKRWSHIWVPSAADYWSCLVLNRFWKWIHRCKAWLEASSWWFWNCSCSREACWC